MDSGGAAAATAHHAAALGTLAQQLRSYSGDLLSDAPAITAVGDHPLWSFLLKSASLILLSRQAASTLPACFRTCQGLLPLFQDRVGTLWPGKQPDGAVPAGRSLLSAALAADGKIEPYLALLDAANAARHEALAVAQVGGHSASTPLITLKLITHDNLYRWWCLNQCKQQTNAIGHCKTLPSVKSKAFSVRTVELLQDQQVVKIIDSLCNLVDARSRLAAANRARDASVELAWRDARFLEGVLAWDLQPRHLCGFALAALPPEGAARVASDLLCPAIASSTATLTSCAPGSPYGTTLYVPVSDGRLTALVRDGMRVPDAETALVVEYSYGRASAAVAGMCEAASWLHLHGWAHLTALLSTLPLYGVCNALSREDVASKDARLWGTIAASRSTEGLEGVAQALGGLPAARGTLLGLRLLAES